MLKYLWVPFMLNEYQAKLFSNLNELVKTSEAFFVTKAVNPITETVFWMFNYRLPSYSDFQLPSAIEARGIMFEMNGDTPVSLASFPMFKFFNLHENPSVMDLDFDTINRVEVKADGSLISTYVDNGGVYLKTKGSLTSQQAVSSYEWIQHASQADLWASVQHLTLNGYTVNMEWTSPRNRIVLSYQEEQLFILNVRNNQTGVIYSSAEDLQRVCEFNVSHLHNWWIDSVDITNMDKKQFISSIESMQGIEGFIVKFDNGKWVKVKTTQYRNLHKTKDSINNDKDLYVCIVNETADELRSLFYDDEYALKRITVAEEHVSKHYNHMIHTVETFFEENKHLSRKDYAVKGQAELDKHLFVLAMEKYIGRDVDYKTSMIKSYDIYQLPSIFV